MENPEEILHSLEEFSKIKPKDIPRELEEYLCFVAKTGNPVYQWQTIKSLFREKLLNVITEFYESCPAVEIPPCPNVEIFNYDLMKNFILEKLDTFASAPFTVQRICELLTTPRKEYNRIDKYMRALEKNILVVSTTEPGRRSTENGEGLVNGIETEHLPESSNSSHDINVEEMDEASSWPRTVQMAPILFETNSESPPTEGQQNIEQQPTQNSSDEKLSEITDNAITTETQQENSQETIITCPTIDESQQQPYVSIEPVTLNVCNSSKKTDENPPVSGLSITALPAGVQQRRNSVERVEAQNKNIELQENNEMLFSKEDKLSDEMELVQPVTEQITPHIDPANNEEILADAEVEKHSENITFFKDQCDTEDEKLSMKVDTDVTLETYKDPLKDAEKLDEEKHDHPQTLLNHEILNEVKWSKVKEDAEPSTEEMPSTFLEENEVDESILTISNCSEQLSGFANSSEPITEPLNESDTKLEVCREEKDVEEPCEVNIERVESDVSVDPVDKLQTFDEGDHSEMKADEKEEQLCEDVPASNTS